MKDFRNYEAFDFEPAEGLTILVGPNAVGKTNLIEAVQLLTETTSFRNPTWAEVVKWGAEAARLSLHAEDDERRHDVILSVTAAGRRSYSLNGKTKRASAGVAGLIPCVLFTPEDLRIVKDSAEKRRAALDSIGTQLSGTYGRLKSEYDRVVRQRNVLLKQETVDDDLLAPWDERLISLGAKLTQHRMSLFDRLKHKAAATYAELADECMESAYLPSWARDGLGDPEESASEALEKHLLAKRREERARGVTLTGPHRDEVVFSLGGKNARAFASQGQQRTIALALKLAEVAVVQEVSGARPLLLLDDVMSELDEKRRHALTALVGESAQTIITTTNLDYFESGMLDSATVVRLS